MAELLAQLRDVDLDRARLAGRAEAPHRLQQLIARDHLAGVAQQVLEQVELALGELDLRAVDAHLAGAAGQDHRAELEHVLGVGGRPALPARRRTALTRAVSSRGENGLAT